MIRLSDIALSIGTLFFVVLFVNFSLSPFSILNFFGVVAGTGTVLCVLRGNRVLPSFLISLVLVMIVAWTLFNVKFNAEFILFGALATILQSTWASHLTAKEMKDAAWLESRIFLSRLLVKIGPLSSLVSAVAVLILIAVSNQEYQSGLLYAFLLSWSLSQLVAVFLLPIIYFSSNIPQVAKNKRVQVVIASSLALIALSFLFRVSHNDYQHKRQDEFYAAVKHVEHFVEKEFGAIEAQLNSLHAFFKASDYVSANEFHNFGAHILQPNSGVVALQWLPVVIAQQKDVFEQWAKVDNKEFFSISGNTSNPRQFYIPLYFLHSQQQYDVKIGTDFYVEPLIKEAMYDAVSNEQAASSKPVTIIQENIATTGLHILVPIFNAETINPFGGVQINGKDHLGGFVSTVVYVNTLFEKLFQNPLMDNVFVSVQYVDEAEPYLLYGELVSTENRLSHVIDINKFQRTWRITTTEATTWLAQPRNWLNWGVLIGCTLGGLLFQMLILLMTAYSSELNRKVGDKTRALILQKERSEQQNKAKSKLLMNLSNELKTPIGALNGLTFKLSTAINPEEISSLVDKINSVSASIEQSVDTLADLSAIESDNLVLNAHAFDFHLFLQQMETLLNVSSNELFSHVDFQYDDSVPHYVLGDKARLQQLMTALAHNGALIFNTKTLELSIKAHRHQQGTVTLFVVLTAKRDGERANVLPIDIAKKEFEHLTSSMTMAKEICQRLEGDIKLAPVSETGNYMLSASFKLAVEDKTAESRVLDSNILDLSNKHIAVISDDKDITLPISAYIEKHGGHVKLYSVVDEVALSDLKIQTWDIIFMSCLLSGENGNATTEKIIKMAAVKSVPIIGVAPEYLSPDLAKVFQDKLAMVISKPLKNLKLNHIINRYL